MTVTYRIARISDLREICSLGNEVSLFHHKSLPDIFAQPEDLQRNEQFWEEAIEKEQGIAFIAEQEGRVIGFVTGEIEDEEVVFFKPVRFCRVGTLGVTVQERGRGIGRGLMAELERWASSHSAVEIHLNVWKFNEVAIRLYEELGYEARAQFMVKGLARQAA